MNFILYFLISMAATTVGAVTGMGGGVIIKPLLDVLGQYPAQTIGVLSSVTVFAMAIVSVAKNIVAHTPINYKVAITLAIGSVLGGFSGQLLLELAVVNLGSNSTVTIVQNAILALLIISVYLYMVNKEKIKTYHIKNIVGILAIGIFLGTISSFVGIGGGPINVAIIIFAFSYETKMATVCSIVTIFFAQISKLFSVYTSTGFGVFDLSMLPVMVVGAVLGGFIGTYLSGKFSNQKIEKWFNYVQMFVFITCIFNISKNLFF